MMNALSISSWEFVTQDEGKIAWEEAIFYFENLQLKKETLDNE